MTVRKSVIAFVIALLCAGAIQTNPALAQKKSPPQMKFAVINLQLILRDAAATKTIRPQIEKLKKNYESQFKKYEQELRAMDQDLQKQRTILSPEAYASKRKAFKERVNGLQREVQTVQRLLDQAGRNALGRVHRSFHEIRAEIAKERSLHFIFPRSGLLHVDPQFDITSEVLKRLNKKLPSVTVKMPSRPKSTGRGAPRQKKQ
jgi:Skp family chaperone for outer membrane proteins